MPLMRRRPLRGAAIVGGTAYVASRAGAKSAAAAQQPAAPQAVQPAPEPAPQPPSETTTQKMAELEQMKHLLDAGALTQAEFDAQKQRILSSL